MVSDNLKLSLIQTNLHWEDKKANLQMLDHKLDQIDESDIIILPEMFTTGFTNNTKSLSEKMEGETHLWMKRKAKEKSACLCGSFIVEEEDNFYNRFMWVEPDGKTLYYDKKHLFAMAGEDEFFTAGNKKQIINYKGWKINLQVCYDLRFPVWSRRTEEIKDNYDLLIFVASWPKARVHAWSTLLKARAIENMSYCVGVNRVGVDGKGFEYTGASVVLNCLGEELASTDSNTEAILTEKISHEHLTKVREKLPFHKDQDQFKLV